MGKSKVSEWGTLPFQRELSMSQLEDMEEYMTDHLHLVARIGPGVRMNFEPTVGYYARGFSRNLSFSVLGKYREDKFTGLKLRDYQKGEVWKMGIVLNDIRRAIESYAKSLDGR